MVYDYTQNKTSIFPGINDQPQQATSTQASNASDLIAKLNSTLDNLNTDLQSLGSSGGSPAIHPVNTKVYFDTANGDDNNNDGSQANPKATLQGAIDSLKGQLIITAEIIQSDNSNQFVQNVEIDMEGVEFSFHHAIPSSKKVKTLVLTDLNMRIEDIVYFNWFDSGDSKLEEPLSNPYRLFSKNSLSNNTIEFNNCTIETLNCPVLDSVYSWSFNGCTFNMDGTNNFYGFIFQSNVLGEDNNYATVFANFSNCTFNASNGMGYPWDLDRGRYDFRIEDCTFNSGFSQILVMGWDAPNSGYPDFVRFGVYGNNYQNHSGGIFQWSTFRCERRVIVQDNISNEFSDYSGGNLIKSGIDFIESYVDSISAIQSASNISQIESDVNTLQTDVNNILSELNPREISNELVAIRLLANPPKIRKVFVGGVSSNDIKFINPDNTLDQTATPNGTSGVPQDFVYDLNNEELVVRFPNEISVLRASDGDQQHLEDNLTQGSFLTLVEKSFDALFLYTNNGNTIQSYNLGLSTAGNYTIPAGTVKGLEGVTRKPNKAYIYTALIPNDTANDTIYIHDEDGNQVNSYTPKNDTIDGLTISPSGKFFAWESDTIYRFNPEDGSIIWEATTGGIAGVTVTPFDKVVILSPDSTSSHYIETFDAKDGSLIKDALLPNLLGESNNPSSVGVTTSTENGVEVAYFPTNDSGSTFNLTKWNVTDGTEMVKNSYGEKLRNPASKSTV